MRMTLEIHHFILSNAWAINYYLLRVNFDMERKGHGCVTYTTVCQEKHPCIPMLKKPQPSSPVNVSNVITQVQHNLTSS